MVLIQTTVFIISDIQRYSDRLSRSDNNPAIQFYGDITDVLEERTDDPLHVYHDVRMYVPPTGSWNTESAFEMLSYHFIQTKGFDVLLLLQSRINDYTNPDLIAIDQEKLDLAQEFYKDADQETLSGYELLFRNDFGLIFVRDGLIVHWACFNSQHWFWLRDINIPAWLGPYSKWKLSVKFILWNFKAFDNGFFYIHLFIQRTRQAKDTSADWIITNLTF